MIKELCREAIRPIQLLAGDILELTWRWDDPRMGENLLARVEADKGMTIDEVIIFRFEDMYGLKEGYSMVAGKSK